MHSRLLIVSSCVGERATKRMEERFRERKGEKKRETGRVLAFMSLPCACVRCVYAASATIKWPIVLACKLRLFSGCDYRLQRHRGVEEG